MSRTTLIFDCECYPNYFLAAFRRPDGKVRTFELYNDGTCDLDGLLTLLRDNTLVSFNGNNYDIPLISAALAGFSNAQLHQVSMKIVANNLKPWIVARELGFQIFEGLDHIDLIEVAPLTASLKTYAGRLHTRNLQDLPYDPTLPVNDEQVANLRTYCRNDLELTAELYSALTPQIDLRRSMSRKYGLDLRSKSDAQIAEAVLQKGVGELLHRKVKSPLILAGTTFRYQRPLWLSFQTPELHALMKEVCATDFVVGDSGSVDLPPALRGKKIVIGQGVYRLGIGGLHSSEECVSHYSDDEYALVDCDVASYYPTIILNNKWFPAHMGNAFLQVYSSIVKERLDAKHSGDKVTADALKITINGSFGKLGNKYSALYSPNLLIQVTLTGQLALLMLIEHLEQRGVRVVSANTDGIVLAVLRKKRESVGAVITHWEQTTGFDLESTEYRSLHCRDVNNYVAVKPDGSYKCKGIFAPTTLSKNPANAICTEAVVRYLVDGTPPEMTIAQCDDVRKFVTLRNVKGGAVWRGEYLGKVVRWYYSTECRGEAIHYKVNNYTVARSDGARPAMRLPETIPVDLDLAWYCTETESILKEIGV